MDTSVPATPLGANQASEAAMEWICLGMCTCKFK